MVTREDILRQADECVNGRREYDYGTPEDNFAMIARLWNSYVGDIIFDAKDVANMMILLKVARAHGEHVTMDTYVDIAGYAACAGEIMSKNDDAKVTTVERRS